MHWPKICIPKIEYYQKVSSHALIWPRPQGAEKQLSKVRLVGWWVAGGRCTAFTLAEQSRPELNCKSRACQLTKYFWIFECYFQSFVYWGSCKYIKPHNYQNRPFVKGQPSHPLTKSTKPSRVNQDLKRREELEEMFLAESIAEQSTRDPRSGPWSWSSEILAGSIWHKDVYNRTFPCTYLLCHKEPARSKQNTPQSWYFEFQSHF